MKRLHRPCPVCGSVEAHELHRQRFALPPDHPLPRAYDVVACPACDFVFADTEANTAAYDLYYTNYSKYADQGTATGGGGSIGDQDRIEAMAAEIARHVHDKATRIVDIGCANGGLLAELRKRGYTNLLGIDPSHDCVANTKRLFDIPAVQGWLGALPPEAAAADLVILSHVMEHVLDLADAVRRARAILGPRGMVYVEVPDAANYTEFLAAPFQDFNTEHINHFGLHSLKNLFTPHGFVCVAEGTKSFAIAAAARFPACFALFQLTGDQTQSNWRRSPDFMAAINRYIAESDKILRGIDARLGPVLSEPVIVWGVGQLTLKLLVETKLAAAHIVAFTDGNPMHHDKRLHDTPVVSPESLRDLPPYPIIVGSLIHHNAIAERIHRDLSLKNRVVTLA